MKYGEYVQQLQHLKIPLEDLDEVLNSKPITRWAYKVHDKDTNEDGTPKEPHVHVMMAFRSDQTAEFVAKWFKDEPQYIQKNKLPQNAYENMCSYLIHETESADGKYKYPAEEVRANFDFVAYIENIRQGVSKARSLKKKHPIADVLDMICDDKIPRIRIDEHLTNLEQIKYRRDIEEAYRIRDRRKSKELNRIMDVVYITGKAGTGKTTFAKMMAQEMNYTAFVSGGSNDPLEGYQGEECVILDDFRGDDWKMNDFLKLTDNNTNSRVKSRYSNKLLNDCKLMFITSVKDIDEVYASMKDETEPIEQLMRRCKTKIILNKNRMRTYQYDENEKKYVFKGEAVNPVPMYQFIAENSETIIERIKAVAESVNERNQPW